MPAPGQRTSAINASLGIAPVNLDTGILADATKRLDDAYKSGALNFNDLLDAATTRPKARKALMQQLDVGMKADAAKARDLEFNETLRPETEKTATLISEIQSKKAVAAAEDARADEALRTPEVTARQAQNRLDASILGGDNATLEQMRRNDQLTEMGKDLYGNRAQVRKVLATEYGVILPDNATDGDMHSAWQKAKTAEDKRTLDLQSTLLRLKQVGESSANQGTKEMEQAKLYRADETIKRAQVVKTQAHIIGKMLHTEKPTAASDMAAIFSFMKLLDPESVVREGEYERAKMATGVVQRYGLGMMIDRVSKGLLLTPKQRKEFFEAAQDSLNAHTKTAQETREVFVRQARAWNLRPDVIVSDVTPNIPGPTTTGAAGALGPGEGWGSWTDKESGEAIEGVWKKNPDGTWSPKASRTPGIDAADESLGSGAVRRQDGDILVIGTALPPQYTPSIPVVR